MAKVVGLRTELLGNASTWTFRDCEQRARLLVDDIHAAHVDGIARPLPAADDHTMTPIEFGPPLQAGKLHKDALTVSGESIWDEVKDVRNWNEDVILPVEKALTQQGGIVVLRGNLAPKGCVLKPSAASAHLMKHRGRAVVFEDIDDYKAKIDDEALDIDETCVMVLKNCGPRGYPGMADVGNKGLPPKVLRKGITDMVRISDARMSGTAYDTVLLHTSPEAARGGPLAIVKNGDFIELDVDARRIHLDISEEEMQRRLADWRPSVEPPASGYARLFHDHVEGADTGADFDFLKGCRGSPVGKDAH